jgi:germination protein M
MKTATVVIALLVIIVGAVVLWSEKPTTLTRPAPLRTASQSTRPTQRGPKKTVVLFFASQDQKILQEEIREILGTATTTEDAKRTLAELVKGPESDLAPTLPRAAQVRSLFIDASGTAYADFDRELKEGHRGGAQEELCSVFSIVDTLTSNFAQIKRVQILVEGVEIPTLAGHVDTRMPLPPRYVF